MEIRRIWGDDQPLELAVSRDPGEDDDPGTRFVLIPTHLAPAEARALLNRVYDEWWVDASTRGRDRMNIRLRFV